MMDFITHHLTAMNPCKVFGVWLGLVPWCRP